MSEEAPKEEPKSEEPKPLTASSHLFEKYGAGVHPPVRLLAKDSEDPENRAYVLVDGLRKFVIVGAGISHTLDDKNPGNVVDKLRTAVFANCPLADVEALYARLAAYIMEERKKLQPVAPRVLDASGKEVNKAQPVIKPGDRGYERALNELTAPRRSRFSPPHKRR